MLEDCGFCCGSVLVWIWRVRGFGFFVGVLESFVTGFGVREREERDSTRLKYVTALQAV